MNNKNVEYFVEMDLPTEVKVYSNTCQECDCTLDSGDVAYCYFDADDASLVCEDCYYEVDSGLYERVYFYSRAKASLGESENFRSWYEDIIDPIAKCPDLKKACFGSWGGNAHENMREIIHQIYFTHVCGDTLKVLPSIGLYCEENIVIIQNIYKEVLGIDISKLDNCRGAYKREMYQC